MQTYAVKEIAIRNKEGIVANDLFNYKTKPPGAADDTQCVHEHGIDQVSQHSKTKAVQQ